MNDGLDAALVLDTEGGKPSKPYRTSPYTVRQYCALPYAQRVAVDAECDALAGIERTAYADETSVQPYTVGRATQKVKGALAVTISPSPLAMTTAYVHPAPSPALHTLNAPEYIDHHAAHPDSLSTYAAPEVGQPSEPLPDEKAHADFAFTPAGLPEVTGPACAYPGWPLAALTDAVDLAATPAPTAPIAHPGVVYETTNYDLFHLLPENRVVDPGHVRKLVAQISERNLLRAQPLEVTVNLGIIDGQHRLAAARELGLPVYYKVGEQLSENDITALNMARKNWQATDYLHMWTVKRKPAYVAFTDFRQRHPRISFSNTKILLSGGTGGSNADEFRRGLWDGADDTDVALAEQVAELVERIADEVPTFKQSFHTGFVGALYHCATKITGFDARELLRTILAQPLSMVPCASHKQWLEMLGRLYNYRKDEKNRLRFE